MNNNNNKRKYGIKTIESIDIPAQWSINKIALIVRIFKTDDIYFLWGIKLSRTEINIDKIKLKKKRKRPTLTNDIKTNDRSPLDTPAAVGLINY